MHFTLHGFSIICYNLAIFQLELAALDMLISFIGPILSNADPDPVPFLYLYS